MKKAIAGVLILGAAATGGTLAADRAIDPYTDKVTHYELVIKSDIPQGERVEIHKDKAQMDLIGWNDEYKISIIPQIPTTQLGAKDKPFVVEADRPLLSKRMEYKSGDVTAFIEPKEGTENEFDIDFTLDAKPDTNVFTYKIKGAEEFDFFYQPALTAEEIAEGAERPENVIGSYAVYHKTKANNCTNCGHALYQTGKIAHIFRPKAIDANGAEQWAELSYISGVLSVTVPQKFLDEAVYPVRVDPTFGYTSVGASNAGTANARGNVHSGSIYTATTGDTITNFSIYSHSDDAGTNTYGIAAYSVSSGQLSSRLETVVTTPDMTGIGWITTSSVSFAMANGVTYGIAVGEASGASGAQLRFDTLTGNAFDRQISKILGTSWTHNDFATQQFSIYATYTASGGGSPTPITPKVQIQAPIIINAPTILQ